MTHRFAGVSGLFVSVDSFPPALRFLSNVSPLTHAVSLTTGMWEGARWGEFRVELLALAITFVLCVMLSSKVFRWE